MALLLKLENAALFVAFSALYYYLGLSGWLFLILFFAPDLVFIAYLKGPKVGAWAWAYNFTHHRGVATAPFLVWLLSQLVQKGDTDILAFLEISLILHAHIAFDRMLGYGLKHESTFQDTHLGRIGRK